MGEGVGGLKEIRRGGGTGGSYRMNDQGLFYIVKGQTPRWLSAPFEVLAYTRDNDSRSWGKMLRWRDADGCVHEWAMPDRMLVGDYRELFCELLDGGLKIATSKAARSRLVEYITTVKVEDRARAVDCLGWHRGPNGEMAFVLPDAVIGATGERILLQSEKRVEAPYKQSGTVDTWKTEVAALCPGNSRLVFGVSLAFAGPLLVFTEEIGGGFHLVGTGHIGKSITQRASGSVWGGGGVNGFLASWRATVNGLESVAAAHCDAFLPLDEIAEITAREAGEAAYMLANGSGKARASRTGGGRPRVQWRILFLSSGEITLADKLSEISRRPRAGQEVRFVNIVADAGASHGIFEDLHGSADGGVFAEHLKAAAARHYGVVGRHYVELLTRRLAAHEVLFVRAIKAVRVQFLDRYLPKGASGQVRAVCARFALAAIGGRLATMFGLTGWQKEAAETAAVRCFKDWLQGRGSAGDSEIEHGIQQVIAFIGAHGSSRFEDAWSSGFPEKIINRVGFRKREGPNGEWQYMVLPEAWRTEVCKGFNAAEIAREMVKRKMLVPDSGGKTSKSVKVKGHGKVRLYVLADNIIDAVTFQDAEKPSAPVAHDGVMTQPPPPGDSDEDDIAAREDDPAPPAAVSALLERCRREGVELHIANGGTLKYVCRDQVKMPPDLLDELRRHKEALRAALAEIPL